MWVFHKVQIWHLKIYIKIPKLKYQLYAGKILFFVLIAISTVDMADTR
jgi:hypothetical protein